MKSHWLSRLAGISVIALLCLTTLVLLNRGHEADEQYLVYSACIEDGLTGESHSLGDRKGTVLIAAESAMVTELSAFQQLRYGVGSLINLQRRPSPPSLALTFGLFGTNLRAQTFDSRFQVSADYRLLHRAELSTTNLNEQFPRSYGYITLSSIAFNRTGTEALF